MEYSTSAPNERVWRFTQLAKLSFNHPSVVLTADLFFLNVNKVQVWAKSVGRRGQPLASKTTDPHDIFEDDIYINWPCPTQRGMTVDWFYLEIKRLSYEVLFTVRFYVFVYIFVCCVCGAISPILEMQLVDNMAGVANVIIAI